MSGGSIVVANSPAPLRGLIQLRQLIAQHLLPAALVGMKAVFLAQPGEDVDPAPQQRGGFPVTQPLPAQGRQFPAPCR